MGSYSLLKIGDHSLYDVKSTVDRDIMTLFCESDKRIRACAKRQTHQVTLTDSTGVVRVRSELGDDIEPYEEVEYAVSLAVARDRLEVMGFRLVDVKRFFIEEIKERLSDLEEELIATDVNEDLRGLKEREVLILKELTFDKWLEAFSIIVQRDLHLDTDYWYGYKPVPEGLTPLLCYILAQVHEDMYGVPCCNVRGFLRAAVEIADTEAGLVYDLTALVSGGYIDAREDLCSSARQSIVDEFSSNHKIIILTECSSDKWVLENALRLLYPHLCEYYAFMDFEGVRAPGGAGPLATTIKAFIGAGIVNRCVALFDNDTAAQTAIRGLHSIPVPANVRILCYPDIELANNYPTLGPQGMSMMNVNGLAGGLELYFGRDVLQREDGTLTPIQWRGYDKTLGQYQGEIIDKEQVQDKLKKKLKLCQSDNEAIASSDWSGLRSILDLLRTAFHTQG